MSEPEKQGPDQVGAGDAAAAVRTQAVKPVKSHRVRELPPPPKPEEVPEPQLPIATGPRPRRDWRPPWYRPAVPGRWMTLAYVCGLVLLVFMTGLAVWTQATRPARGKLTAAQENVGQKEADGSPQQDRAQSPKPPRLGVRENRAASGPAATPKKPQDADASQAKPSGAAKPAIPRATAPAIEAPRAAEVGPVADNRVKESPPEGLRESPAKVESRPKPEKQPDGPQAADGQMKGKLQGRSAEKRGEATRYRGGSDESEKAVEAGLRWMQAHQRDDGSWRFNHVNEGCMHYCANPGTEASTTASTGLALLPFLGAGYTHKAGDYQDLVDRGLKYLRSRGMPFSYGVDLRDGSMYGHALATIALCEAYGMTRDAELKDVAQGALRFIAWAQDAKGGGWRYEPGSPGDTTVTGWMLMALKSGQMAGLEVPTPSIFLAERFLSSVQNADGSQYGYLTRQSKPATTAVGLLCRMYTGWRRDHPGLQKGMGHLTKWGPSKDNLYYNYYATQAMFHWAGPDWDAWNRKMRDGLVATQDHTGHASGSWYFRDPFGDRGGRLYNTSLAIMILEVYYRYLPLYSNAAVEKQF